MHRRADWGAGVRRTVGDTRYDSHYARVRDARDRVGVMRKMSDQALVRALAGAARARDLFLANVLATEVENRVGRAEGHAADSPASILEVDRDARISYANQAAETLLRAQRSMLIGHVLWQAVPAFSAGGEPASPAESPVARALRDCVIARGEYVLGLPDGTRCRVLYQAAPLLRDGAVLGASVTFDPLDP